MHILLKYKLDNSNNTRTIIWYKISNDINDLFENLDKSSIINKSKFSSWPTHETMNYLTYIYIDNNSDIKQIYEDNKNKVISSDNQEEVLKLIKQCIREYNLIKILEK